MRTLIVPMAGEGTRFQSISTAKVLHPIGDDQIPMFCFAIQNIGFSFEQLVLIARAEHPVRELARAHLDPNLDVHVIDVEHTTGGPLDSTLMARGLLEKLGPDDQLVITNADQVMLWPGDWAMDWFVSRGANGGIPTVERESDRHSYARICETTPHKVVEVREKIRISNRATIGVYWFRNAEGFLCAADALKRADDRAPNGEFYVAPVYNYLAGLTLEYPLCEFWSLGEPDNVTAFLQRDHTAACD